MEINDHDHDNNDHIHGNDDHDISVFNLILPCILITGIALMSFYMPSDSGEKVIILMTTIMMTFMMMTDLMMTAMMMKSMIDCALKLNVQCHFQLGPGGF